MKDQDEVTHVQIRIGAKDFILEKEESFNDIEQIVERFTTEELLSSKGELVVLCRDEEDERYFSSSSSESFMQQHGKFSHKDAKERLMKQKYGSFLIRGVKKVTVIDFYSVIIKATFYFFFF